MMMMMMSSETKRASLLPSLLVLASLFITAHGLRSLHAWNSLFQSDARAHFRSDSVLSVAHDDYLNRISADDRYAHSRHRHPFILKFPAGCGASCHEAVKAQVGSERHNVVNAEYAQVMLKTEEVRALQNHLGQSVVQDYTAMLPELKVERKTRAMAEMGTTCGHKSDGENVLQVVLAPHDAGNQQSVLNLLNGVVSSFRTYTSSVGSIAEASLHIDGSSLLANVENVVTYELHCLSGSEPSTHIASSIVSELITLISSLPMVLWVEYRGKFHTSNRWASGLCQSGDADKRPMFASGLDGDGLVIGISDTGIDMTHCQFYDADVPTPYNIYNGSHRKVVTYITFADDVDDADGHGTHVASTAAGKSSIQYGDFQRYDGNAKEAKIAFFDIGEAGSSSLRVPGNLNSAMLQPLYDAGAKISSHSWGRDSDAYTVDARNVDNFMSSHPDALVFFAAGNRGDEGASSVGAPSTNKNGICVGASINSYDVMRAVMGPDISSDLYSDSSMAGFSSQGPTADGRLKPDLSAPGWYTVAAEAISGAPLNHCDIQTLRGTSMASPALAGSAILVQQYFKEGFYPTGSRNSADAFTPSGALIKAMLVHSGVSMDTVTYDDGTQASTGGYPSNVQGYGKVRLSNVLNFGESTNNPVSLFVMGAVNSSSHYYASITSTLTVDRYYIVTSSTPPPSLRVTMTYTDKEGAAGSLSSLTNDLELRVKLGGTIYTPLLNEDSASNNIEMVVISSPCSNCNYTIEVRAVSLSTPEQPYALVSTGIITEATVNTTSTSSSFDTNESIGEDTWKAIIVMSFVCVFLGSIVIYLHYFDAPPKKKRREKTFEEEHRDQAAALQYYEEQHRQRSRERREEASGSRNDGRSRRRGTTSGGSVEMGSESVSSGRSQTPKGQKRRKKEGRSSRTDQGMDSSRSSRV